MFDVMVAVDGISSLACEPIRQLVGACRGGLAHRLSISEACVERLHAGHRATHHADVDLESEGRVKRLGSSGSTLKVFATPLQVKGTHAAQRHRSARLHVLSSSSWSKSAGSRAVLTMAQAHVLGRIGNSSAMVHGHGFGVPTHKTPRQHRRMTPIFVLVGILSVRNIMMGMDISPTSAMIDTAAER